MNLLRSFKLLFISVLGLCLTLIFIAAIGPPLLPCVVWYFAFKLILKIKYGSNVYKASGRDVMYGKQIDQIMPFIKSAVRIEGPVNLDLMKERMLNMIENTLNDDGQKRYERLKYIYVMKLGYHVWKKCKHFDINDHFLLVQPDDVIGDARNNEQSELISESMNKLELEEKIKLDPHSAYPNNEDKQQPNPEVPWDVTVKNFLNDYGCRPTPEGLPPWNLHVLDERNGKYTVLLRFHHSIADGLNLMRMFAEDIMDEPCKISQPYRPTTKFVQYLTLFWSFCHLSIGLFEMLTKKDRNPLHGITPLTGRSRHYLSNPLPMETFLQIRKKVRVSMQTIAFSCVSSAVSLYFQRRGANVDTISVFSPIPLQSQNPNSQIQMKNKFNAAVTTLTTLSNENLIRKSGRNKICDYNSLERLARVKVSTDVANSNPSTLSVNHLVTIISALLPEKLAEVFLSSKGPTTVISGIPASKVESKIWNGTQVEHLGWVNLLDPLAIAFSLVGYNGTVRFSLTIDDSLLKNVKEGDTIMKDVEDEVKNIARELEEADLRTFPGLKEIV